MSNIEKYLIFYIKLISSEIFFFLIITIMLKIFQSTLLLLIDAILKHDV